MRLGDFKLHEYFEDGALELYDLAHRHRRAEQPGHRGARKTRELLEVLEAWRKEVGAPVPGDPNPEYDRDAELQAIGEATRR